MPSVAPRPRAETDRCPGVLRLVEASDGYLARIRLPGGLVDLDGLRALAGVTRYLGDGRLELTSRGNVQLRALSLGDGPELSERLFAAGLWPSVTHERVRNIVASPLAAEPDLAGLVRKLDVALCADPRLAELSGRFLFGLDGGTGDIAALRPDVLAVVRGDGAWVEGETATDVADDVAEDVAEDFADGVVDAMLAAAHAFLDERQAQDSNAWRVDELTDGRERLRDRLGASIDAPPVGGSPRAPAGVVDGRQVLLVPLGRLTVVQLEWLAATLSALGPNDHATITPWRSIVLPTASEVIAEGAAGVGLGIDHTSRWYGVSACAGKPGCAKALADVQAEAARTAGQWQNVHFSGCARRCGRPADTVVDVVATEDGYVITGA